MRWRPACAFALIISLLFLPGCGYHLRGSVGTELGTILPTLAVEGVDTESGFGLELVRALRANGVTIVPSSNNAQQPLLSLQPVKQSKEVLSVDREVRAREFRLISSVRFQLKHVSGAASYKGTARVRQDLVVDPNQVLGSEQEEHRLLREMEQELAQRVMLRLRLQERDDEKK
jgi:LPS-assembly lipoprotein